MSDYISREAAINAALLARSDADITLVPGPFTNGFIEGAKIKENAILNALADVPAADVVPWEWLELYADYFWAGVSMPEFVREAKMFYESSNKAMQGGVIDG